MVAFIKQAIELLKVKGTIVEVELLKQCNDFDEREYVVLLYEFKDGLNKYLATANAGVKTLADVIAFNKNNEAKVMPYFKQETLERSEAKADLESKEYIDSLKISLGTRKIIDDMMKEISWMQLLLPV